MKRLSVFLAGTLVASGIAVIGLVSPAAANTAIVVTSEGPSPSVYGQTVIFDVSPGGTWCGTSEVSLSDGGVNVGSMNVPAGTAQGASFYLRLAVGTHSIVAAGDVENIDTGICSEEVSDPVTQTVNRATTSTSLSSSANTSTPGQSVT